MAKRQLPSPEDLRQLLRYEPATGKFYWLQSEKKPPQWNGRWAGKEAFTCESNGYLWGRIDWRLYPAHRIAWAISYGEWPKGQIDHINGCRGDNRLANLREVDQSTNSMNAARPSHNTSGHIGVSFEKRRKRWEAHIGVPGTGRKKHLGYFDEIEEAVAARKAAERQFGYHKNHGREMRA